MIKFTVYGEPKGKGRPRFVRIGSGVRTYTPKSTETYQNDVLAVYMDKYKGESINGPIRAEIDAYMPIPKSYSKKRRAEMEGKPCDKKPDADNIAKSVLDALQGYAYEDDKQITLLTVTKKYSDTPRVEIVLREL